MLRAILATAMLGAGAMFGAIPEAQAQGLVPCAPEHGFCRVPYPTRVIYGARGRNVEIFVREGGVPCSNRVFGDPAPGVPKRCSYVARRFDRGHRGYDDGFRRPRRDYGRDYDRGFRDDDDGYRRPPRRYEVY